MFVKMIYKMNFFNRKKDNEIDKIGVLKASILASNVLKKTEMLLKSYGSRPSGSKISHKIAEEIKKEFEENCDSTDLEEFEFNKKIREIWKKIIPFSFFIIPITTMIGLPIIGNILLIIFYSYGLFTYFFNKKNIEKKFKNDSIGTNVYGIIQPQKEMKKTVFFTAHHDSAKIAGIKAGELEKLAIVYSIAFVSSLIFAFISKTAILNMILGIIFLIPAIYLLRLKDIEGKEFSPGAGDNLVSSSALIALSKYFYKNKPDNTRIVFASFDAEEIGLHGSEAFFKKHVDDFDKTKSEVINLDCLYNVQNLTFLVSDGNSTLNLDSELANKCVHIVKNMGYQAKTEKIPIFVGATDAFSAAKFGYKATTVTATPWKQNICHTLNDTLDKIEPKLIEEVLSLCIKLIEGEEEQKIEKKEEFKKTPNGLKYSFSSITKKKKKS